MNRAKEVRPSHKKFFLLALFIWAFFISGRAWAAPATYALDSKNSALFFDVKSGLHGFSGTTHELKGTLVVDLDTNQLVETSELGIPVLSLDTGIPARNHAMQHMFDAEKFPDIKFRVSKITVLDSKKEVENHRRYQVNGMLKIREIERELSFECSSTLGPDTIGMEGEVPLSLSWFKLEPPVLFGLIRVEPDLKIRFKTLWTRR